MYNCRATFATSEKSKCNNKIENLLTFSLVETSSASPLFHKIKRLAVSNDRNRGKNDLEKFFFPISLQHDLSYKTKLGQKEIANSPKLTHSSGHSCCCCYCIGKCNWNWKIDTSHWKHKIIVRSLQKICSSQKIVIVIQISYLVSKLLWLVDIFFLCKLKIKMSNTNLLWTLPRSPHFAVFQNSNMNDKSTVHWS